MVEGTGELLIRGSESPYLLTSPTTLSGVHDTGEPEGGATPTGAITQGVFTTPAFSFQTETLGLPVFVDVAFSQAVPSSGTGFVDADGNVRFRVAMRVDLHIKVGSPVVLVGDCVVPQVTLTLDSTAPYDPDAGRVTVQDTTFTIPAAPTSEACPSAIVGGLNDLLTGSGHSLRMTLDGDLTLPPAPGCPTATEVVVDPAGESALGNAMALTATVAQDPASADDPLCDDVTEGQVPAGLVDFREGTRVLGTATLDEAGQATFSTSALPTGTYALTAVYRGGAPFAPSASAPVTHRVAAKATLTVDMPSSIRVGAAATEFDVTIANSALGSDLLNGRLQVTLRGDTRRQWASGSQYNPWTGALAPTIEYSIDGGPFTSATIVSTISSGINPNSGKWAVLAPGDTGIPVPAGGEVVVTVRLALGPATLIGPAAAIFELIPVDPDTGAPAPAMTPGATSGSQLQSGTIGYGPSPNAVASVPAFFAAVGPRHNPTWTATNAGHTVRAGQDGHIQGINTSPTNVSQIFACRGDITVELDGVPVPIGNDGWQPSVRKGCSTGALSALYYSVPATTPPGLHSVVVRYSGDDYFRPAIVLSTTITVLPARGPVYECLAVSLIVSRSFGVSLQAHSAGLPVAVAAGTEVDLHTLDLSMFAARTVASSIHNDSILTDVNTVGVAEGTAERLITSLGFTFAGGAGSGSAPAMTTANRPALPASPNPLTDPNLADYTYGFPDATGRVVITGEPGDVVPVTVDRIAMSGTLSLLGNTGPLVMDCGPRGEPVSLGSITVAGTVLSVDAPSPARAGHAVTLVAQVHPAGSTGVVEFLDGTTPVGMAVLGPDGTASYTTSALGAGSHSLRARFHGGIGSVSTTSDATPLAVLPQFDCGDFAVEGNGAVVRLVYMELLGRCPDQAGFDFWVGRLDSGTSPEAFARSIARTPEAVGVVVNDGYRTMLGRDADAAGKAFWTNRLLAHGRYDQLLADLAASPELWNLAGGTDEGFVTRVYERLLHRAPDRSGLDYWVGRLNAGTSRRVLVLTLANLDEPLGVLVTGSYAGILARAPFTAERTGGIAFLRATGDRSGLYAELIGRPEFSTRAQAFPNPS